MRKTTICLLVLLCACAAFGQNVPQWKVVQYVALTKQTSPISNTVVFTPTTNGLYRVSAYIAVGGSGSVGWTLQFSWQDVSGAFATPYFYATADNRGSWNYLPPITFSPLPGQPFTYTVFGSGGMYDIAFTIEQLQ